MEPWIIIAAHNEEARLGVVLDQLQRSYRRIVVVDDGSSDRTASVAKSRGVRVLRHAVNLGQGAALQTGIEFALGKGAEILVTFDADGQHRVEDIAQIIAPLKDGIVDFSLGSRFLGSAPGIPVVRRLLLGAATLFTRASTGMRLSDVHNGLRGMTRRGAEAIRIDMNGMEHASQILNQISSSRLAWIEVPVTVVYTRETLAKGQRSSNAIGLLVKLFLERISR